MTPEISTVNAEVLRVGTPVSICRLAAGEHQMIQKTVRSMSAVDVFAMFQMTAREKSASKLQTPFLGDNEVELVGRQCGLLTLIDDNGKLLDEAEAVCLCCC